MLRGQKSQVKLIPAGIHDKNTPSSAFPDPGNARLAIINASYRSLTHDHEEITDVAARMPDRPGLDAGLGAVGVVGLFFVLVTVMLLIVTALLTLAGYSLDETLVEIIEIKDHPWFLGCQFHPEFKSKPGNPHPLFRDFIKASLKNAKKQIMAKE